MPDDTRVQQLLDELLDSPATPEEVCGSCPELLPQVRDRWRQICHARAELDALFPPRPEPGTSLPASPAEGNSLPVISGYEVEAVIGCGGMGVVFRARHLRLNRVVALKMALAGAYAGPHERERFQREAEAVAALRHPNVVQVYDIGDSDGRPYFTMEYVEGGSLAHELAGRPRSGRQAAALMTTLAGAVHAAHLGGIVHRDLKPANVLLAADGTPKVSDFGLARRLDGEAGLTRTGTAVGTASYMAPEQAQGKPDAAGPPADIYALGAILYELLTGRPPFRAATAAETVQQVIAHDPVPPSRLNARVPRDLETICLKCLHKEPRNRYATAAELADDLGRFQRGEAIAARPEGRLGRLARLVRRRPALAAAIAVSALLAVALAGGGAWTLADRQATARAADAERAATERAADDDLKEMEKLLRKSSWTQASAALERAKVRLGDRGSEHIQARLDQGTRELKLADRLDEIRLSHSTSSGGRINNLQCARAYEQAFREGGFGQVHDDPQVVADLVRRSNIQNALVAALDHWSSIAPDVRRIHWVLEVARRADWDSTVWRDKARNPVILADQAALVELIKTAPMADESVSLLLALPRVLSADSQVRVPFLKRVQQAHPDDFWANLALGDALWSTNQAAESIRYYQAATAIRPGVSLGYHNLGLALSSLTAPGSPGRLEEAIEQFRKALEFDPLSGPTHGALGHALLRLGRYDEAIAEINVALRLPPPNALLYTALGYGLEAKGRHDEAIAQHRLAVKLEPTNGEIQRELRNVLMRLGRFDDVQAAWAGALETKPPAHDDWYGYAELCLFLGKEEEFRAARTALLTKFGGTADPHIAERTSRACLLQPASADEVLQAVALAGRASAADRSKHQGAYPFFQFVQGLAEYRQGRFDRAISVMRGDAAQVPGPSPRLVLAMALHRSGQESEARKTLAVAVLGHDWRRTVVRDQDGWISHVLRREAEGLILPNLPDFLEGKYQPRDNDERLALLGVCQFTNRSFALARLYADAFAADPRLAEDFRFGNRHNAACYAALAGCGRGADAAGLSGPEQARWRAQARKWLRADLSCWKKFLEVNLATAPARELVRQRLMQWQSDPDLAGVREATELLKLPADERKDCLALWDEISQVVKASQAK